MWFMKCLVEDFNNLGWFELLMNWGQSLRLSKIVLSWIF